MIKRRNWDGHILEAGLAIIKSFEGWSPIPYLCPANRWTIAYGSCWDNKGRPITAKHPRVTKEQGLDLLRQEVRHSESAVKSLIRYPLNPEQFSALVSFSYNVGSGNLQNSTLRMKLNRGDVEGASAELPKWRRAGGKILNGLVKRRRAERLLFDTP